MSHIELLKQHDACDDAVEWAANYDTLTDAWDACERPDWMLWLHANGIIKIGDRDLRLFACECVRYTPIGGGRTVWDLLTDERSRNAVEVAERYANGEATRDELYAARGGAWSAARYDARSSATAAAWSSATADASDGAWDAAGAAAWHAASDSAWSATSDAERDAAWAFQADLLRKRVGNPFREGKP